METDLSNMENIALDLEKAEDNYKVPNLEKGISIIEYQLTLIHFLTFCYKPYKRL